MTTQASVAHIAGRYRADGATAATNFLTYGVTTAAEFGFTGIKLFVSPNYGGAYEPTYQNNYPGQTFGNPAYDSASALGADPAFAAAFADPRITRYYLNTWSFQPGALDNFWTQGVSNAQLQKEYNDIYTFARQLLLNYSGKEFTIQNWEGDWQLLGITDPAAGIPPFRVDRMAAYLRVREQAIIDAQRSVTGSTSRVYHAVEVNRVLDPFNERVHRDVLTRSKPRRVSFSAYEIINDFVYGLDQATAEATIDAKLREATRLVRKALGDDVDIYISEFGWPEREAYFTLDAGGLIQQVLDTANDLNMREVVFWNLFDNEVQSSSPTEPRGYYIYDENGDLGAQGTYWSSIL